MLQKINQRATEIEVPGIRQFANQISKYDDPINLTIGEPDFATPENVKQAGIEAIQQNKTGYSHNAGMYELRKAVSQFFNDTYQFFYHPETEIVITNGASEAIDSILRTILQEGDEVIFPAPIYSAYEPIVHLCGAKVVYLNTADTNFLPSPERLEQLITDRTKAIILNYPSNPTGVTINQTLMTELVSVIEKHELFIISDEIYSENTFTDRHHSFANYPQLRNRLFLVHGLSKSHAMTGWRVGFVLGPEEIMKHVLKVHLYNSICVALPSQYAAIEALTNSRDTPAEMNIAYMERRDFVYDSLIQMGFDVIKPNGAFYIFPSIKKFALPSYEFATALLQKHQVAVVPGSTFTKYGEGYIRISYANSMEMLAEGMERLEQFVQSL